MRKVERTAEFSRKPFMAARSQDEDEHAPVAKRAKGLHDYYEEPDDPLKLSLKDTLIELATTLGGILGVFFLISTLVKAVHPGALP